MSCITVRCDHALTKMEEDELRALWDERTAEGSSMPERVVLSNGAVLDLGPGADAASPTRRKLNLFETYTTKREKP